jgi:predicted metalloendopeptidase
MPACPGQSTLLPSLTPLSLAADRGAGPAVRAWRHAAVSAVAAFFALAATIAWFENQVSGPRLTQSALLAAAVDPVVTPAHATDAVDDAIKRALDAVKHQRDWLQREGARDSETHAEVPNDQMSLPHDVAASMNFSVNPCDNFYEYACGTWLKETKIPEDKVRWARSWDTAKERVQEEMVGLMVRDWPEDSPFRKLKLWYESCMDLDAVTNLGSAPLQPMLQRIDEIETLEDLHDYLVEAVGYSLPTFMQMQVQLGQRRRDTKFLYIETGAMVLHKADMYNTSIEEYRGHTAALRRYFVELNVLAGSSADEAEFIADRTLELETIFAQWKKEDLWHHSWINDPLGPPVGSLTQLEEVAPSLPWRRIFTKLAEDCEQRNQTCNQEVLDDEKLIILKAPYFLWKVCERSVHRLP